jgi:predicted nucleic acid-binding protein
MLDACTLANFAAVGRLDLLRALYEGKCAWTEGVELETRRGVAELPYLQPLIGAIWLGTPVATDDPLAVQQVDRIRRALGGAPGAPTQHLGEADTIYHAGLAGATCVFATDDRDAYYTAQRRGLRVIDTPDILRECYDAGLLACPEAYELLHKMAAAGRGVAVPGSHWYVCPPTRSEP